MIQEKIREFYPVAKVQTKVVYESYGKEFDTREAAEAYDKMYSIYLDLPTARDFDCVISYKVRNQEEYIALMTIEGHNKSWIEENQPTNFPAILSYGYDFESLSLVKDAEWKISMLKHIKNLQDFINE